MHIFCFTIKFILFASRLWKPAVCNEGKARYLHRDDGLGQDVQRGREAGGAVAQAASLADALLEIQALLAEALQGT